MEWGELGVEAIRLRLWIQFPSQRRRTVGGVHGARGWSSAKFLVCNPHLSGRWASSCSNIPHSVVMRRSREECLRGCVEGSPVPRTKVGPGCSVDSTLASGVPVFIVSCWPRTPRVDMVRLLMPLAEVGGSWRVKCGKATGT